VSDALNFLVKTRPEAMQSYFAFLKEAGRHLDPKTRNLISVITKVHAQTENGLRQYLARALREGATPDEVLDALLMAFPALGLAKIVWAVDVILKMDLPGFHPDRIAAGPVWHSVIPVADLKDGETAYCDCDGRSLFVHKRGSALKVYDSRCPHQVTNIPHLALQGTKLTCPKHEWEFDIESGACTAKGDRPLTEFPHRIEEGRILAFW
jgi:nitrite reductase/ring-hydroxylating ferredoxin subunit/alkylhydroperoxidase/carboxymuconolactone decarboxylase family protein YurZ